MTKRERLERVFAGEAPDRPPMLGGWIASPRMLLEITGETEEAYKNDPEAVAIKAYKILETDGLIGVFTTRDVDVYRCVDQSSYLKSSKGISFEEAECMVEELPSPGDYERNFDFEKNYAAHKNHVITMQKKCGDMVYMPAHWGAGIAASWYGEYGYENYFLLIGLRPDLGAKLLKLGGAMGRCSSSLVAKSVEEGIFPKAVLMGEDICTQRGPMFSIDFMEEHLEPALTYGLEPLLDAGCRPVWHCDGDVRPMFPLLLRSGIQGFQGFQPECGMALEEIVKMKTREGKKLLIFGPLSVTTELPVFTPEEVRKRVRDSAAACKGEADLVFFTANTINPDVPLENLLAFYDEVKKVKY